MTDPTLGAILLHIESPGGHVARNAELGDDIAKAAKLKPVHAQIEDTRAIVSCTATAGD